MIESAEDDDPEWRNLDYSIEVGDPPTTLWEFVRQYDWNITSNFCAQSEWSLVSSSSTKPSSTKIQ